MRTISHFINGQSVTLAGAVTGPVYDPSTGEVQARLEHGDAAILAEAVAVAKTRNQPGLRSTPSTVPG
jgi:malonate-semialdehyde dehydrogenase (acetylating) / methylmalonate-semialdehyde dehydrogenase